MGFDFGVGVGLRFLLGLGLGWVLRRGFFIAFESENMLCKTKLFTDFLNSKDSLSEDLLGKLKFGCMKNKSVKYTFYRLF